MNAIQILKKHSNFKSLSIFILWLFQLTAIIGVSMGYQDWFINKTPMNLILIAILLVLNFPIDSRRKIFIAILIFILSILIEWIGVHFEFLFGAYKYGKNLGVKIDEVPLLIGINWLVLIFCTGAIAERFAKHDFLKIILGASLMVFLDFFIETSAPLFDFWSWDLGYATVRNYVAWFVFSLLLHLVYRLSKMKGDFSFALHLYASQLVFFVYFYLKQLR